MWLFRSAWTQMFDAIHADELESVRKLLDKYPEAIDWKNSRGYSILFEAAQLNRPKMVDLMLSKGPHLMQAYDVWDKSPLFGALLSPEKLDPAAETVKALLTRGANVNETDKDGKTFLHCVSWRSMFGPSTKLAELLIESGAKFRIWNKKVSHSDTPEKLSPIHYAVFGNRPELVDYYLKLGKTRIDNYDEATDELVGYAAYWDRPNILEIILRHGVDVNKPKNGLPPLHIAISCREVANVQILLNYGADINYKVNGRFSYRTRSRLTYLALRAARPLILASVHWNESSSEYGGLVLLLDKGADPREVDGDGRTPLHYFMRLDRISRFAQLLLDRGADINARDNDGITSLHRLVQLPSPDKTNVEFLLKHGALVNIKDNNCKTPLHYVLEMPPPLNMAIVELLVGWGGNLRAEDCFGISPLSLAATIDRLLPSRLLNITLSQNSLPLSVPNIANAELSPSVAPIQKVETELNLTQQKGQQPIMTQRREEEDPKLQIERQLEELNLKEPARQIEPKIEETEQQRQWREQRELKRQMEWDKRRKLIETRETQEIELIRQGGTLAENVDTTSQDWLRGVEKLYDVLRGDISDDNRIKIAIIDSGVHGNHAQKLLIREYKDFTGTGTPGVWLDKTSHGSTGVDLIAQISPDADIYIARVFEEKHAKEGTQDFIAKAIRHAQEVWKVDIITLACGFETWHESMESAAREASNKGILIFAAASNEGNIQNIKFPAWLYDESVLFCTFACDCMGKAKNKFNPAPIRNNHNFAFLGENVPVSSHPTKKTQSGTSYATFIGAAITALILDFSRQEGVTIRNARKLKKFSGMSAVFKIMADGGKDGDYECVVPWKLMGIPPASRDNEVLRTIIRDTLSVTLDRVRG